MRRLEANIQNSFGGDILFFSEPLGEMTWWLKKIVDMCYPLPLKGAKKALGIKM